MLKRTFVSRDTDLWKILYTSMIRPHLEYAVQVRNLRLIGDIEKIEKVQRKATKTLKKLSKLIHDQRLAELGLTSLKDKRMRGDLIQMFKIMKRLEVLELEKHLNIKVRTREHNLSYNRESFKCRRRNYYDFFVAE